MNNPKNMGTGRTLHIQGLNMTIYTGARRTGRLEEWRLGSVTSDWAAGLEASGIRETNRRTNAAWESEG